MISEMSFIILKNLFLRTRLYSSKSKYIWWFESEYYDVNCTLSQLQRVKKGASEHALRNLHSMELQNRNHLLRETQAHINELKSEIKQYKAQRSARLIEV